MSFAVHTFETNPESGNLGFAFHESLGEGQELYFLVKFDPSTPETQGIAETIFGAIVDSFAQSGVADSYDRFEDALKAANVQAHKLGQKWSVPPQILVAFFDFHQLYLSQSNESEAYLVRGSNISQISETLDPGEDIFLNILSGQVAIGDVVLLATNRVLRAMTTNQVIDIFARSDFSEAVQTFRHELSTSSEEDILVTAIGIGKEKKGLSSAGFLSKVVSKVKSNKMAVVEPKKEVATEAVEAPETTSNQTSPLPETKKITAEVENSVISKTLWWESLKNIRPQKNLLVIAGTILVVLLGGILIRFISGWESAETQVLREKLSIAREALQQADTFLLQGERKEAAIYLLESQESVQEILSSKSKDFRSDAQFLLADIEEKQLQVENARKVTPQLLADLGVKNDNLEAVGLLSLRGGLFVHDLRDVYKTVRNIVEKGLPISDNETIVAAGARVDQGTLLFLTDRPRIVEYRDGLISPMATEDETWKNGIDIQTYGRYAYVLDPVENQIWKYERRRANYSPAIAYNQGADLSRAVSATIDGSIYILSDDGTLQKLFRGAKADYGFKEVPSVPFSGKNIKVYTSTELEFLYILDPDNRRILVFVKGDRFATYKKQVLFDIADARDFVVDDTGQKVNVLTKDKIYEFSL
jgi:hypothetical protein